MSDIDIDALATTLDEATRTGNAVPQLTSYTDIDVEQGYGVQRAGVALRTGRGEQITGVKLGLTSKAKAAQMGVSDVIIGVITDAMAAEHGGTIDVSGGVHPRVEPEVAFKIGADIGPDATDEDILAAVTHVAPALEIIDSRYKDFKFTLEDVVADNTSASGYVVGPWSPVEQVRGELDLANLGVRLLLDDEEAATGSTADILGDPWQALSDARRMAAQYGQQIDAGAILLAGAATAAAAIGDATTVRAEVAGLGHVGVNVITGGR